LACFASFTIVAAARVGAEKLAALTVDAAACSSLGCGTGAGYEAVACIRPERAVAAPVIRVDWPPAGDRCARSVSPVS